MKILVLFKIENVIVYLFLDIIYVFNFIFFLSFVFEIVLFMVRLMFVEKNFWENFGIKEGFCGWKVFFYDWKIFSMFFLFVYIDFLMNLFF